MNELKTLHRHASHLSTVELATVVIFVLASIFWVLTDSPLGGDFIH